MRKRPDNAVVITEVVLLITCRLVYVAGKIEKAVLTTVEVL